MSQKTPFYPPHPNSAMSHPPMSPTQVCSCIHGQRHLPTARSHREEPQPVHLAGVAFTHHRCHLLVHPAFSSTVKLELFEKSSMSESGLRDPPPFTELGRGPSRCLPAPVQRARPQARRPATGRLRRQAPPPDAPLAGPGGRPRASRPQQQPALQQRRATRCPRGERRRRPSA